MLTQGWTISYEGGVISILQKVKCTGNRAEIVSKVRAALCDGVHQSVHYCVEYNDRRWISLVNYKLQANGDSDP